MASPIAPNTPKKGDLGGVVRKLFQEDGDVDSVEKYANAVGMDAANTRVLKILKTEGAEAMFKAMTTHDDGTPMTYAESRARYG